MERITARWSDGRTVRFWDREITGDPQILSELSQRSRITGDTSGEWRRNGVAFMSASRAVRAPELPVFESRGISVPL